MIFLFTNWYADKDAHRNDENRTCLEINLANPLIDRIHLMCDGTEPAAPDHKKIVRVPVGRRPTYDDYFRAMSAYPDDVRIIANTDIFFNDTLSLVVSMPADDCYALTRYDVKPEGLVFNNNPESQDVWIFKGPLKPVSGDFPTGKWACDGRIAHEIHKAGYSISNPCKSIIISHLHRDWRDLGPTLTADDVVPPPYRALWPTSLGDSDVRLGIGIPHNFPHVPMAFFDSFMMMDKPPFVYLRSSAGNMDDMRNGIVREAMRSGCTHLIMMDTDQLYDKETIPRLLAHRKMIAGCLVYRRYPPFDPLIFRGTRKQYLNVTEWNRDELITVDATGTGCLLFDMKVFEALPAPWFKTVRDDTGKVEEGEDFYFCAEARAAGFDIYVDTSLVCGHLSQMIVNEGTYKLYNRVKEAELRELHRLEHDAVVTKAAM